MEFQDITDSENLGRLERALLALAQDYQGQDVSARNRAYDKLNRIAGFGRTASHVLADIKKLVLPSLPVTPPPGKSQEDADFKALTGHGDPFRIA
jgi:hypothetical protein